MKVLIIGKNGQLGKSLKKIIPKNKYNKNFFFIGRGDLDLSRSYSIRNYFKDKNFDLIINCAAFTNVDKAEEDIEAANQINHLAVAELAKIVSVNKSKLIHISTDYVFDGKSSTAYSEIDSTNPINVYGKTKLNGENAILKELPKNTIIIRTSWLYSEYGNNFVDTMLRLGKNNISLKVVDDQIGSPTNATDLAKAILHIIKTSNFNEDFKTRIYHFSNLGSCSWYDFARQIFEFSSIDCDLIPISTWEYPTKAIRPQNTYMSNKSIISEFKVKEIFWKDSLKKSLTALNDK
jgi:dTDP-4-dehydrorhamnose reductase